MAKLHNQSNLTKKTPPVPSPDGEGIKGWGGYNTTIASTNRTDAMARLHNQTNLTKKTLPVPSPDRERIKGWGDTNTTIRSTNRHVAMANSNNRSNLTARRRQVRKDATKTENLLWQGLRRRQVAGRKFRRQHSIGRFIVDFYCPEEKLIVEIDGSIHDDPARAAYDDKRHQWLEQQGMRVIRIDNESVLRTPNDVLEYISSWFTDAS